MTGWAHATLGTAPRAATRRSAVRAIRLVAGGDSETAHGAVAAGETDEATAGFLDGTGGVRISSVVMVIFYDDATNKTQGNPFQANSLNFTVS